MGGAKSPREVRPRERARVSTRAITSNLVSLALRTCVRVCLLVLLVEADSAARLCGWRRARSSATCASPQPQLLPRRSFANSPPLLTQLRFAPPITNTLAARSVTHWNPLARLTIAINSRLEAVARSLHHVPRTTDSPGPTSRVDMTPTAKSLPAWVDRLRDLLTANMKENKDLISYALATTSASDAQQPRVSPRCFPFLLRSPSAFQRAVDMRLGGPRSGMSSIAALSTSAAKTATVRITLFRTKAATTSSRTSSSSRPTPVLRKRVSSPSNPRSNSRGGWPRPSTSSGSSAERTSCPRPPFRRTKEPKRQLRAAPPSSSSSRSRFRGSNSRRTMGSTGRTSESASSGKCRPNCARAFTAPCPAPSSPTQTSRWKICRKRYPRGSRRPKAKSKRSRSSKVSFSRSPCSLRETAHAS